MLPGKRTSDGALYVTTAAYLPSDTFSGGVMMNAAGAIHVNANTPQQFSQGRGFMNNGDLCIDIAGGAIAGYINGLPVTATGALKCQLNQPVSPGDAYIGGIRVGPLGGIYIVDATPPADYGFSSGFSNGFDIAGGTPPPFSPASLFASGEQGAWYDPSDLSTMFQDSEGTTPVTAVGQPVGLILDKSKGLALGAELVTNGDFSDGATGWTLDSAVVNSGALDCSTAAAWMFFATRPISTIQNAYIEISFTISNYVSGRINVFISPYVSGNGTYTFRQYTTGYYVNVTCQSGATGFVGTVDNISVKELPGNHAFQATAAKRPLLAATGLSDWTNYDAVDDVLNTAFPSSLGSSCTVAKAVVGGSPTILTGQTIGTSWAESTDNAGVVIVNRALSTQETTDLTAWLTAKGATT